MNQTTVARSLVLFFLCGLFLVRGLPVPAGADQGTDYSLAVRTDRDRAKYDVGETIVFQTRLLQKKEPVPEKEMTYTITGDGGYRKTGKVVSGKEPARIEARLDRPGMVRCLLQWKTPDGKTLNAHAGAAVDPLKIVAARSEPDDFDRFWSDRKKELRAVPMNPRLTPVDVEKYQKEGLEVFDVQVDCLGDVPVSGYLAKPIGAKPKSLPIIVSYHGAGVRSAGIPLADAKKGALALDVNAHGIPNGKPKQYYDDLSAGPLKNYSRREGSVRYFVDMYLRLIRSLEFVKSLPEWDGKILAVTGSSQGGGQALAAAGLDPDVNICCAYVPALCYHSGHLDGEFGGWPGFLRDRETSTPERIKQAVYVDAALLAGRSKAETMITVGYVDYTCSATSVYVAYNNLSGPKRILEYPAMGHSTPPAIRALGNEFIWKCVKTMRQDR